MKKILILTIMALSLFSIATMKVKDVPDNPQFVIFSTILVICTFLILKPKKKKKNRNTSCYNP